MRDLYSDKTTNINVQSGDHIFIEDSTANIKATESIIDNEGFLVFENVGKVKAAGRTLSELRNEFESLMQPVPDLKTPSKSRSQTLPRNKHYYSSWTAWAFNPNHR